MRIACWVPKAKNTLLKYVTLIAFPLPQWLHEIASKCYVIRIMPVLVVSCQLAYRVKVAVAPSIERPHAKRNVGGK